MKNLVVLALVFFTFLSGESQAQWGAIIGTTTSRSNSKPEVASPLFPIQEFPTAESDQKILNQLQSLIKESGWFSTLQVRVKDGVVILEGSIKSREHLQVLLATAQRLPMAVAVINKVRVEPPLADNIEPVVEQLREFGLSAWQMLPVFLISVFVIGLFIFLGGYLNQGIRSLWAWRVQNPFLIALLTRLTMVPLWILAFYFALRIVGVSNLEATILGATGFLTLLFALAFKGIGENYLAGILLASRSPFTKGDLIKVGEHQGYVQNLNMRGTTIIDLNGNLILIPNIMVIQSVVENRTANPSMRTSFFVNIGYHESISRVQELIVHAMAEVRGVLPDPAPSVVVEELLPSAVKLRVQLWLDAKNNAEARVKSRAMMKAKDILLVNGIAIPDDAREIIFADDLKVHLIQDGEVRANQNQKKEEIRRAAAYNLEDSKKEDVAPDAAKEKLMDLAEKNPLPMNRDSSDLLEKSPPKIEEAKETKN